MYVCADVTLQQYRNAIRSGTQLDFVCSRCRSYANGPSAPAAELDMDVEDSDAVQSDDEEHQDESFTASEPVQHVAASQAEPDVYSDNDAVQLDTDDETGHDRDFHLVNTGTKRGKPLLVDSHGYTYNVKKRLLFYAT